MTTWGPNEYTAVGGPGVVGLLRGIDRLKAVRKVLVHDYAGRRGRELEGDVCGRGYAGTPRELDWRVVNSMVTPRASIAYLPYGVTENLAPAIEGGGGEV